MLDVSQVDRRTGQDWPYTEKQMVEKLALQDPAQQLYPPAGRTRFTPRHHHPRAEHANSAAEEDAACQIGVRHLGHRGQPAAG